MSAALTFERRSDVEQALARIATQLADGAREACQHELQMAAYSYSYNVRLGGDRACLRKATKRLQKAAIAWDEFTDLYLNDRGLGGTR